VWLRYIGHGRDGCLVSGKRDCVAPTDQEEEKVIEEKQQKKKTWLLLFQLQLILHICALPLGGEGKAQKKEANGETRDNYAGRRDRWVAHVL
jgi:hypothetical protein